MAQGGWGQGGYGPPPAPGGYGPPPGQGYGAPMPMVHVPHGGGPMAPTCRHCGGMTFPYSKISTAGWVLFAALLLFCFPLCWLGLLLKDSGRRCGSCQMLVGPLG